MSISRPIVSNITPQWVSEGAGVRLRRSIATPTLDYLDPFLLFDHFGSDDPQDYLAGFPMHPHRGIETVTYMLAGEVRHADSMGNQGTIQAGDVQWMTAGGGIMHEEMPGAVDGRMEGFQLWVNLPASHKMMPPRYQEIKAEDIPLIERSKGTRMRVIAGEVEGIRGPVTGVLADPTYVDVSMEPRSTEHFAAPADHAAFVYLFAGSGRIAGQEILGSPRLLVLGEGDVLDVTSLDESLRFLLVMGRPLHEPIARYGPFVMNTQEEIRLALQDLRNGTFVR
ncbi:MAG: pirin family protein [Anaerolineaceae bacterium]|jgi:redox-sensitive bicupin YhaK (pirin superfamily)|nr:pirin family protein [Anaerolineaceae bacterium]